MKRLSIFTLVFILILSNTSFVFADYIDIYKQHKANSDNISSNCLESNLPIFNSIEEAERIGVENFILEPLSEDSNSNRTPSIVYEYTLLRTRTRFEDVGRHPDFPQNEYASGYWFSNTKQGSINVSIGFGLGEIVSVSVDYDRAGSTNGYYKETRNDQKYSYPAIEANITYRTYRVTEHTVMGQFIREYEQTVGTSNYSDIFIKFSNSKFGD